MLLKAGTKQQKTIINSWIKLETNKETRLIKTEKSDEGILEIYGLNEKDLNTDTNEDKGCGFLNDY